MCVPLSWDMGNTPQYMQCAEHTDIFSISIEYMSDLSDLCSLCHLSVLVLFDFL